MSADAQIRCSKCSKPASDIDPRCRDCGGALIRVCPECGFEGSIAKRFCDKCGTRVRADTAVIPSEKARPPKLTGPLRGSLPTPVPGAPLGGGNDPFRSPNQAMVASEPLKNPEAPLPSSNPSSLFRQLRQDKTFLFIVLGAFVGFTGFMYWAYGHYRSNMEVAASEAAEKYLDLIAAKDMDEAYEMLSTASQNDATVEEFKRLQETTPWEPSSLELLSLYRGVATFQYSVGSGPSPRERIILFVREKDRWARDFDDTLLEGAKNALRENNSARAYAISQKAVLSHGLDPLAHLYLCDSAAALNPPLEAERSCRLAYKLGAKSPRISPSQRSHLSMILAKLDMTLKNYSDAVQQFSQLLSSTNLNQDQRCDLLINRGEAYASSGQYLKAQADFRTASYPCLQPQKQAYLRKAFQILTGDAGPTAISLAQSQTPQENGPTVLQRRRAQASRSVLQKDLWSAQFLGGARYRVTLKNDEKKLLSTEVDLWSKFLESQNPRSP